MNTQKVTLLTLVTLVLTGCDPEPAEGSELRTFPAGSYWDDVRCVVDNTDLCYGHRRGTEPELYSQVFSQCYLDSLVTLGMLEVSGDGYDKASCDPGSEPTTAPDVTCYQFVGTAMRLCFGGEDGWLSQVRPSCEVGSYTIDDFWATGSCSTSLGDAGYDDVFSHSGNANKARAFLSTDAFDVLPWCYIRDFGLTDAHANECEPDPGWCCTDLPPDQVCFAADEYGQCDDGVWCPMMGGQPVCEW